MRKSADLPQPGEPNSGIGGPQEGVPSLAKVLGLLQREEELEGKKIVRLELHVFPSQDATWRAWTSADDEPLGGYFTIE